ncbi:MAG: GNAT family N-acetyltransferase [Burkholderiales bacterium]
MPAPSHPLTLALESADEGDFEALLALRLAAMRDGLERLGRFDPALARERLGRSFSPPNTRHIVSNGQRVGFVALTFGESLWRLDHLYVHPMFQHQGIGTWVLEQVLARADAERCAVALTIVRRTEAFRFWQKHRFKLVDENDWDQYFLRPVQPAIPAPGPAAPSGPAQGPGASSASPPSKA